MTRFLALVGALALLVAAAAGIWLAGSAPDDRNRALVALGLRPDPLQVARTGLESMRREQQLSVLSVRFLTRQASRQDLSDLLPSGLLTAEKTLIVAGTMRYALDLAKLDADSLSWDTATSTLAIRRPPMLLVGPSFHVADMDEASEGAVVLWLTQSEAALDDANWEKARLAILAEARSPALRDKAVAEGDAVLVKLFTLPLVAAGFEGTKVRVIG